MNIEIPEKVKNYAIAHALDLTFAKEKLGWGWTENSIGIPVYNQSGVLLYKRIRHLDFEELKAMGSPNAKKFSYDPPQGNHPALYCLHKIDEAEQVVVCEGEPDCAVLWQNKIPAVTSTGGVTKFDDSMAQSLAGKKVYLCLDNDVAGHSREMKIARQLVNAGCKTKIVVLPEGVKDVAEFFAQTDNARDSFLKLITNSLTPGDYWSLRKPKDFATITGEELLATEFPPNHWLIDRILPKEGFVFIFAAEASYKTYVTLDLALAVAAGTNWLGQAEFKVEHPGKVLFIDKENPMEMIQRRIKGLGYTPETARNIRWVKYPEKLQLGNGKGELSEFMRSLSEEVAENNIVLIVIDSFVDLMIGSENSAEDTQIIFTALRECFPDICIMVLHHENKPGPGVFRSDSQRTRGSGNINAQCSTMFRLELVANSKTEFTIKQTKARDALKLDKFLVEARIETDDNGKTYVAGFDYKGVVPDTTEDKVGEAIEIIKEMFLTSPTLGKQEIIDTCLGQEISRPTAERAIKRMIDAGNVNAIKDPANKRRAIYIFMGTIKNAG